MIEEFFGIHYFKLGRRCKKQLKFLENNQVIDLMSTEDILKSYKEMAEIFIEAKKVGIVKHGDFEIYDRYLSNLEKELLRRDAETKDLGVYIE